VDDLTRRVLARAYKKREKGVPVKNRDTGRVVYVSPDTLDKNPGRFEKVQDPDQSTGDPRWRGKAKPPKRPAKPHRPEVPRDPPPAPVKPPVPAKRVKPPKAVKPVPMLKPPKIPEPSPQRRWRKLKDRFASAEEVVRRFTQR
jgi:hypothetical protein